MDSGEHIDSLSLNLMCSFRKRTKDKHHMQILIFILCLAPAETLLFHSVLCFRSLSDSDGEKFTAGLRGTPA